MAKSKQENSKKSTGAQPTDPNVSKSQSTLGRPRLAVFKNFKKILVALLAIGLLFFVYNYLHTRNELNKLKNPQVAAQNETQAIVARIDKTVELPNETPALATVKDASKFKNNSLFNKAMNGDKVLIYSKANLAVLYRPSTQKVIELVPVGSSANQ